MCQVCTLLLISVFHSLHLHFCIFSHFAYMPCCLYVYVLYSYCRSRVVSTELLGVVLFKFPLRTNNPRRRLQILIAMRRPCVYPVRIHNIYLFHWDYA
jgi:hypothetical protein